MIMRHPNLAPTVSTLVKMALAAGLAATALVASEKDAHADDATVTIGVPPSSDPPPVAVDPDPDHDRDRDRDRGRFVAGDGLIAQDPELKRSPFRLSLAPMGITSGKGFGY